MAPEAAALPKGSWILITGVNGFVATHLAKQLLARGYKVRGTVRSTEKSKWLVEDLFSSEASAGSFELVAVPDMVVEGAFQDTVRGVSAIAHVATVTTLDPDPNKVVPQTIAGVENILKAAAREASVKVFAYTSTAAAAVMPLPETPAHVDQESWNDAAVAMTWAPPPYTEERALITYIGSKVETEKALWKFVKEQRPHFRVNVVSPFSIFGPLLHPQQNMSTNGMIYALYNGNTAPLAMLKAAHFIHVEDVALLHVAAILDASVDKQRIHGWGEGFIWNDILAILRKMQPDKKFIDDLPYEGRMIVTVDDKLTQALVKKWGNQDGLLSLERGIKDIFSGAQPVF